MSRLSRDLATPTRSALELYEAELIDLSEQIEHLLLNDDGEADEARAVHLSRGHWRCVQAFLAAALEGTP